jgi:hypothetical protein
MTGIGRQIPHFELVDLNSIQAVFSSDKRYRYLLSLNYNDTLLDKARDKVAVVILKNPSAADEHKADAIIRKVETFVYHRFKDVRWLHIVNIFQIIGNRKTKQPLHGLMWGYDYSIQSAGNYLNQA